MVTQRHGHNWRPRERFTRTQDCAGDQYARPLNEQRIFQPPPVSQEVEQPGVSAAKAAGPKTGGAWKAEGVPRVLTGWPECRQGAAAIGKGGGGDGGTGSGPVPAWSASTASGVPRSTAV